MSDVLTKSAPKRVWLQVDTNGDADDRSEPIQRENWDALTWCYESVGGQEVTYTRDDLVAELIADLRRIQRRAAAHPDDDDADRKRNLYHCESIALAALARIAPNELHDKAAELRGRGE